MGLKGKIVCTLLVVDTFVLSYAVGFNSRHVLVEDPTLPPYVAPVIMKAAPVKTDVSKAKLNDKANKTDKNDGKSASAPAIPDKKAVKSTGGSAGAAKPGNHKGESSKKTSTSSSKTKQAHQSTAE